jgi:hypothetical protein
MTCFSHAHDFLSNGGIGKRFSCDKKADSVRQAITISAFFGYNSIQGVGTNKITLMPNG